MYFLVCNFMLEESWMLMCYGSDKIVSDLLKKKKKENFDINF